MKKTFIQDLEAFADPNKASLLESFFKTGKGEYGEGDVFVGITVPQIRSVAKKHRLLSLHDIETCLEDQRHEVRLCALLILVDQFKNGDATIKKTIYEFYLDHLRWVNNWDLVDQTAYKIVGEYLVDKDRKILRQLANSKHLWSERVAIVSTLAFIRRGQLKDTFEIAKILLARPHDLLHKATGWMLREAGKGDTVALRRFLDEHARVMPRTMLRYAIEKFDEKTRKMYLMKK